MSKVPNTRKDFKFSIEAGGVEQFLIQKVTLPEVSLAVVEHGSSATEGNTKTPGKLKVGQMVVEKILPSTKADRWAWDWFTKARNGTRSNYAFFAVLHELNESGTAPIASYDLGEIWASKISRSTYQRADNDGNNVIETVTFEVDKFEQRLI